MDAPVLLRYIETILVVLLQHCDMRGQRGWAEEAIKFVM